MKRYWEEKGYDDFADGVFGNGGQNLYVSRAGVLQRIFRFDFNRDGYADLLFVNSQDFNERPPIYVCADPLGSPSITELATQGAYAAAVGDLNGDGYDEIVLGNQCNGTHEDITAYLYYGGPEGLGERNRVELPAPNCRAVAIGDFNGDGRPDLAFACDSKLRLFYQDERGFLASAFTELELDATHLAAADLDGDGCAELYARVRQQPPRLLWGGKDGIQLDRCASLGKADAAETGIPGSTPGWIPFAEGWAPRILRFNGVPHLFRPQENRACFFPVIPGRRLGEPWTLDCPHAVSAALGDIDGDGHDDLVLVACEDHNAVESSWIYWGSKNGFDNKRRTALPTISARDATVADLDGDGCADIVVCQGRTDILNTTESLVFRGRRDRAIAPPACFTTHDATTALIARPGPTNDLRIIFVNHVTGRLRGDIPVYLYLNSANGFSPDRRVELPGWSASGRPVLRFQRRRLARHLHRKLRRERSPSRSGIISVLGVDRMGSALTDGSCCLLAEPMDRRLAISGTPDTSTWPWPVSTTPSCSFSGAGRLVSTLTIQTGSFSIRAWEAYTPTRQVDWGRKASAFSEPRWLLAADFNNDGWLDLFISQIVGPRCLILWGGPEGF